MSYAILYAENGEFVADFDSHDEAIGALREYVAEHPRISEQVGLMEFDDAGHPAGAFVPASALTSEHEQYA